MKYRNDETYKALEKIITAAGVDIVYRKVPNDCIDGEIWARSDDGGMSIMMPDEDVFPNEETACLILGHEMGHILSGLDSPDYPSDRRRNEAVCDLIGVYLYKLAEMTAGTELERVFQEYEG